VLPAGFQQLLEPRLLRRQRAVLLGYHQQPEQSRLLPERERVLQH
jgi:hypothetical protein